MSYHTFLDIQHVPAGGIVVPQKVYTSGHIFQVAPPIQFTEYGHRGISLRNAFVENFAGMVDGTTLPALAPAGTQRIATRIEWPGYGPWSLNMNIVDRTRAANPINKAKLAHNIARAVHTFMQENAAAAAVGAAGWEIRNINFDNLYLLEYRHVSTGSWQPVLFYVPSHA